MILSLTVGIFFLIGLIISFFCLPGVIFLAHKFKIIDLPDGVLKLHNSAVPRLGGVPLYLVLMGGCAYVWYVGWLYAKLLALFLTLLFIVGIVDDFYEISQGHKFLAHSLITLIFFIGCTILYPYFFASYLMIVCGYLWVLTFLSAFNLIDVMDGLASVIALGTAGALLWVACIHHSTAVGHLLALYSGAVGGFLWYNYPPAHIYLGESGSGVMGGFLGAIALLMPWGSYARYGWGCPIILFAIPLLELTALVVIRLYKHIPFYRGSRDHFCHYLQARGYSNFQVLGFTICAQLFLWMGAYFLYRASVPLVFIGIAGGIYTIVWVFFIYTDILLQKKYSVAKYLFLRKTSD